MRGSKPIPAHLKLLAGNPGKRGIAKDIRDQVKASLASGVPLRATVGDPPDDLGDDAKRAWAQLVNDAPWLTVADRAILAAFCTAMVRFAEAERAIKIHGLTYETVNGGVGTRPEVRTSIQCSQLIRSLGSEIGLTPTGRQRMQAAQSAPQKATDLPPELTVEAAQPPGA